MHFARRLALTCVLMMIFSTFLALFLHNAEAQDVAPMSQIRFAVEDDTMVQTLPTIKDKMAEIRITHCSIDLTEALNSVKRPEIRRITPINMGEESWLLRIDLARPDILLKAKVIDGVWKSMCILTKTFKCVIFNLC